jgi:hypothetical protein
LGGAEAHPRHQASALLAEHDPDISARFREDGVKTGLPCVNSCRGACVDQRPGT